MLPGPLVRRASCLPATGWPLAAADRRRVPADPLPHHRQTPPAQRPGHRLPPNSCHGKQTLRPRSPQHSPTRTQAAAQLPPRKTDPPRTPRHSPPRTHYSLHMPPLNAFSPLSTARVGRRSADGPVQSSPARSGLVRSGPIRSGPVQSSPVQSGPVRSRAVLSPGGGVSRRPRLDIRSRAERSVRGALRRCWLGRRAEWCAPCSRSPPTLCRTAAGSRRRTERWPRPNRRRTPSRTPTQCGYLPERNRSAQVTTASCQVTEQVRSGHVNIRLPARPQNRSGHVNIRLPAKPQNRSGQVTPGRTVWLPAVSRHVRLSGYLTSQSRRSRGLTRWTGLASRGISKFILQTRKLEMTPSDQQHNAG